MQITCFVGHVYNLKNSLKFKLLAFWRKQTPFVEQKCTYENVTKNLGRALPPLIWTKSKRAATFFVKPFLRSATSHGISCGEFPARISTSQKSCGQWPSDNRKFPKVFGNFEYDFLSVRSRPQSQLSQLYMRILEKKML